MGVGVDVGSGVGVSVGRGASVGGREVGEGGTGVSTGGSVAVSSPTGASVGAWEGPHALNRIIKNKASLAFSTWQSSF